ncbi:MAG: DUF2764 domain-containing protein [Bacteroidales bacterium]|jgi:hypothetical protein|nr:DUF2764 domain-containing protein [Bacteroidales bacterium]
MNYYCFIAGLPEIEFEDSKLAFSVAGFKEELQLSDDDARLVDLFYTKFDNQNLLRYLKDKEARFDGRGSLARDELAECLQLIAEDDNPKNRHFPPYFKTFVEEYRDVQHVNTEDVKWENRLTGLYYQWAMKCGNKFISGWFEFNLNLNNILAACTARKYQMGVDAVGDNEVAESIKTSGQRDFGLTGTIDDLDAFQRLADEPDLFEREKKIDLLKWQWLDEQTFFKYFGIERVFAYLAKLEIIERWASLDPAEGGKIFRSLIDRLKESVVSDRESLNLP